MAEVRQPGQSSREVFCCTRFEMNRKGDRSHRDAQSIAAVPSSARRFNSSVTSGQFNLRRRAASDVVASRSNSTSRGSSASLTRGSNVRRHSTADSPISYSSSHKRVAVSASSVHQSSRHYTSAELVTTWHVSSHHFRGENEVTSGSGSRRVASTAGSTRSRTQIRSHQLLASGTDSTASHLHSLASYSSQSGSRHLVASMPKAAPDFHGIHHKYGSAAGSRTHRS